MYNKSLKERFIAAIDSKLLQKRAFARSIFVRAEEFEREWGKDLCQASPEELRRAFSSLTGPKRKGYNASAKLIKDYSEWCMAEGVPGAHCAMDSVNIIEAGVEKMRLRMVANPLHLSAFLDAVYSPLERESVDVAYRSIYWLAFIGVSAEDALCITPADIDFEKRRISYMREELVIFDEAFETLKKAATLRDFAYDHPHYSRTVRRDRAPGECLARGIRTDMRMGLAWATLSRANSKALREGRTDMRLSPGNAWLSGFFYRLQEREKAGHTVVASDFYRAVYFALQDKDTYVPIAKRNDRARIFQRDYMLWKKVFSV